jgi:hypothetical protein
MWIRQTKTNFKICLLLLLLFLVHTFQQARLFHLLIYILFLCISLSPSLKVYQVIHTKGTVVRHEYFGQANAPDVMDDGEGNWLKRRLRKEKM